MKRVLILHGSPNKEGNSDTLTDYFLQGLSSEGQYLINHVFTNNVNVHPCQGCQTCVTEPPYECIIHDDMDIIYDEFKNSDIVVFATPMYWGYMTAQLKTVVDRMEAIANPKYFKGKQFILIATYRSHVESTVNFFKRIIGFFGGELHIITYCSRNDQDFTNDIPVTEIPEKLQEAENLGKNLSKK